MLDIPKFDIQPISVPPGIAESGIYLVTYLPSGDTYVGKGKSIASRWGAHCTAMGTRAVPSRVAAMAFRSQVDEIRFVVLKRCPASECDYWEAYFILKLQPTLNTNVPTASAKARVTADYPELTSATCPRPSTKDEELAASKFRAAGMTIEQRRHMAEGKYLSEKYPEQTGKWLKQLVRGESKLDFKEWLEQQMESK